MNRKRKGEKDLILEKQQEISLTFFPFLFLLIQS
jgi:hypothetical protein